MPGWVSTAMGQVNHLGM